MLREPRAGGAATDDFVGQERIEGYDVCDIALRLGLAQANESSPK
jgi:hypothetical protein